MRLYLIRHGQSTNNALKDPSLRVCDPPLSEVGKRQARQLAEYLTAGREPASSQAAGGYRFTGLYCSPFWRALQTAQPIAEALGLAAEVWVDIHEYGGVFLDLGGGEGSTGFPGRTRDQMAAEFPTFLLPHDITEAGWWAGAFEPQEAAHARTRRVADQIRASADTDESVALVAHGDLLDGLLKELLSLQLDAAVYFHLGNSSISRLDFVEGGLVLVRYLNRTEHLSST